MAVKLDLTSFVLKLVPHVVATAPAIARALWHKTDGDLAQAKAELRFIRDHKGEWDRAQLGFQERLARLEREQDKD